jgi:S-adenosylmethionine hydrolase
VGSNKTLEIAVHQGSAAATLAVAERDVLKISE